MRLGLQPLHSRYTCFQCLLLISLISPRRTHHSISNEYFKFKETHFFSRIYINYVPDPIRKIVHDQRIIAVRRVAGTYNVCAKFHICWSNTRLRLFRCKRILFIIVLSHAPHQAIILPLLGVCRYKLTTKYLPNS